MIFPVHLADKPEDNWFSTKSLSEAGETTLVDLARQGNREAFDEIDRRYRPKLCRFLARHAEEKDLAEEIAQQTLVKAFISIPSLKRQDRLGAWLYQIAFRLAIDEGKKKNLILLDDQETSTIVDPRSESDGDESDNLWSTARRVLTVNEYSAVWLKYVDGYKVDSIAKIMQRTRISVRVLLFRARKKLLDALKPE